MPRRKELEQLPMSNIAPGAGKDAGKMSREVVESIVPEVQPEPAKIDNENEDMV